MRITFLTPADNLTGGTRVVAIYARQLQERGHEVLVVSNAPAPVTLRQRWRALKHGRWQELQRGIRASREPGHIGQSGVPHHVLDRHRAIAPSDLPDADILVATWWETARWMEAMPAAKGRKVHLIQDYETWFDSATNEQVKAALKAANLKIAISAGLKRDIERELGDLGIHVVPNAVDQAQFNAPRRERNQVPRVGYIYSTTPRKAVDRYYRAIELARRTMPELQVLAFGAEPLHPDFPVPAGTEYFERPAQRDIPSLYARCDAWLFASKVDSFGLPILESMACRTPVIGLPIGAAPDLLPGGAGVLVNPIGEVELPEAMADALVRLFSDGETAWQEMSDLAHARAHAYTWLDAVARFETLVGIRGVHAHSVGIESNPRSAPARLA